MTQTCPRKLSSPSIIAVTLAVAILLGASLLPPLAGAQSESAPTVRVGEATINPGETATVPIVLSSAPEGVAGYRISVSVEVADVAQIERADYATSGLTATPEMGDSDGAVVLKAADVHGEIQPGASGVTLASVTVRGLEPGETAISVEAQQFDDDAGARISPRTQRGRVVVAERTEPGLERTDPSAAVGASPQITRSVESQSTSAIAGNLPIAVAFVAVVLGLLGILAVRGRR